MIYSLPTLLLAYKQRKAFERGETPNDIIPIGLIPLKVLLRIEWSVFLALVAISLGLFLTAIVLLLKHYKQMPTWAIVLAVLCMLLPIPGGIVIAIILALLARK
jgi:hypothetical protein